MTAKEYLKQVGRMNKEIENKAEEIQKLKDMATRITSSTDKERVQSNSSQDKLGDAVAKIIDLENELQEIVTRNLDKRKYITKQIEELDNDIYYDVLYKEVTGKPKDRPFRPYDREIYDTIPEELLYKRHEDIYKKDTMSNKS